LGWLEAKAKLRKHAFSSFHVNLDLSVELIPGRKKYFYLLLGVDADAVPWKEGRKANTMWTDPSFTGWKGGKMVLLALVSIGVRPKRRTALFRL
jgi:hypothetical protein